jgi:hypothetical protein
VKWNVILVVKMVTFVNITMKRLRNAIIQMFVMSIEKRDYKYMKSEIAQKKQQAYA